MKRIENKKETKGERKGREGKGETKDYASKSKHKKRVKKPKRWSLTVLTKHVDMTEN